ncbi:MAG: DUF3570 domain-containing protein [Bacteroidetes bacterium]|nr:DUF3570 domain-containing protein [Bacteroidota bacterium]
MKKICLTTLGIFILFSAAFAQQFSVDTTGYKNEKLHLEETNLISGYYNQDGNHSAVTGGIGTQKLNDISNIIELKFVKYDNITNNKYTLNLETGLDHHTAASQAFINKSGASKPYGTRFYPSLNWKVEQANKLTVGFGVAYSGEFNYHSYSANFLIGKASKNENTEVTFKAQAFFDRVTMLEPSELIPKTTTVNIITYTTASGRTYTSGGGHGENIPTSPRNTFSGSLTWSQVVNKNFQFALISDIVGQSGLLSLPFHRVYFKSTNDSAKIENLPGTRIKIPLGLRMNYFPGDKVVMRAYYRYYIDDWGVKAHTASLEVPYKISPFASIAPFYRYYIQTAADYFAPYAQHSLSDQYYTSNYDLSAFTSHYVGVNIRLTPKKGVFNVPWFNMIEFRYGHYIQTTGLHADNFGINLRFK